MTHILSIDQGTTSTRAIVFNDRLEAVSLAQEAIQQHYPDNGWVEHDPLEIWSKTKSVCLEALASAGLTARDIASIGITNQRETTVLWDRETGKPIYPAIVWQDRRTAAYCTSLAAENVDELLALKTGLLLDPYFCATKIAWLLDNVLSAREQALRGQLAFGTIDSYLLWQLTGGTVHATDASNASRTMLYNINTGQWDTELLQLFSIPEQILPDVYDNAADFGQTDANIFGAAIPIGAMIGDQQAALVGQGCFAKGACKSTFGTGCFMMANTGAKPIRSKNKLLTTVAYRLEGKNTYALEGSIFIAGAAVQWLQDALHLITDAAECERLATAVDETGGVYFVPAFTGLGAPHWLPDARGAILGLTRDTGVAHIVRAALEAVCYQAKDLVQAMEDDAGIMINTMRVDGGMINNKWLMQFLADLLDATISRPKLHETTAVGAAMLAGLQAGLFDSLDDLAKQVRIEQSYTPKMSTLRREQLYEGWQAAVASIK